MEPASAQLIDNTAAPNLAKGGINKSLSQEIGAGRGDVMTPDSSTYLIKRDPFRSIRRGRQLFQRKFTQVEGVGPTVGDGNGDIMSDGGIGAGLADSCAACHGRPRGSAGVGGNVATRPDSRDASHLFGLGLREMLADEMTTQLRNTRNAAVAAARQSGSNVTWQLIAKGVQFGYITAHPDGMVDSSRVQGVDPDLRIKPFFAEGSTISIREFIVGALHKEMGLEVNDPDLLQASRGLKVVTPAGMVLDGTQDKISAPPPPDIESGRYEIDPAIVDHLEFYLLNYFKPGIGRQDPVTARGRWVFHQIGCGRCHVENLTIDHDRRVADVQTVYDPARGIFNRLFSTATLRVTRIDDGRGLPALQQPAGEPFLVRDIFTDFKRHDLGPGFHERNYDGTQQTLFLTRALWGVGSTGPYGHDGRSMTLEDVILRHGGEAQSSRDAFAFLGESDSRAVVAFLNSLVLFPPDDTASTLDPGNPAAVGFPQSGHGGIKLTVLFNNPSDPE